jgi:hypothetical protein
MESMISYRQLALDEALKEVGVRESGGNNRGERVEWFQTFDSLAGEGYAWCASFVVAMFAKVGRPLVELGRTPSVYWLHEYAKKLGWIVTDPRPGDIVIYTFSHTGIVYSFSPTGIYAVEGNTGATGAVSDSKLGGDGVYRKYRASSLCKAFIRVPGEIAKPKDLYPALVLRQRKGFYAWLAWNLGEGDWKGYGKCNPNSRPAVFVRIPATWWARRAAHLLKRKVVRP